MKFPNSCTFSFIKDSSAKMVLLDTLPNANMNGREYWPDSFSKILTLKTKNILVKIENIIMLK